MNGTPVDPSPPPGADGLAASSNGSDGPPEASGGGAVREQRPHWATPIIRGWIILVGVIAWMVKQLLDSWQAGDRLPPGRAVLVLIGAVLAVTLVQAAIGYFQWRTTTFRIDDEEVRVDRRFIQHSSDRIALSKIQSVDVVQPLAARVVGLARLRIDVGGSSARTIEYLSRADAYRFRDFLTSRAHGVGAPVAAGSSWQDRRLDESVVTSVTTRQIVLGTFVSDNFGWSVLLAAAGIAVPVALHIEVVSVPVLLGALAAAVRVIANSLVKYWRFTLLRSAGGLKAVHGMTTLTARTVPVRRIQGIAIHQPLLWRLTGLYRVQLTVLGSAGNHEEPEATTLLPMGTAEQVRIAIDALWPGFRVDAVPLQPIPRRARWLRWFDRQTFGWGLDDRVVVARHGLLQRVTAVVPHSRVQSIALRQGPLQRSLGLADIAIHIPAGPVCMSWRHLDAGDARRLLLAEMDRCRAARRTELGRDGELGRDSELGRDGGLGGDGASPVGDMGETPTAPLQ